MNLYLDVDGDGKILACATTPINDSELSVFVEDWEYFMENVGSFRYVDGEVEYCEEENLKEVRMIKDEELNEACRQAILNGFEYEVNGVVYHFPFDMESQLNFQSDKVLLENDLIPCLKWTVRDPQGEYKRITITKDMLEDLSVAIFQHRDSNLERYREFLLPQVNSATTIEEIENINW